MKMQTPVSRSDGWRWAVPWKPFRDGSGDSSAGFLEGIRMAQTQFWRVRKPLQKNLQVNT